MASLNASDANFEHHPASFFSSANKPFALLILNQPIDSLGVFRRLWRNATYRVCADGGANALYAIRDSFTELPDTIHGDLDSLQDDVRKFYADKGVSISADPDQYSTDVTKCLSKIRAEAEKHLQIWDCVALGGLGGRFDQAFSLVQSLCSTSLEKTLGEGELFLASSKSIGWLLAPGLHRVRTPMQELGVNVGILPVRGPAMVTTNGLEWDITNWKLHFGGLATTSNHLVKDEVLVKTDEHVLMSIELLDYS